MWRLRMQNIRAVCFIPCCKFTFLKIATRVMPTVKSKIKVAKCVTWLLRLAVTANSLRPSCAQKRVVNIKQHKSWKASENNTCNIKKNIVNKKIICYAYM